MNKIINAIRNFFKNDYIEGEEGGDEETTFGSKLFQTFLSFIICLFAVLYTFPAFGWWGVGIVSALWIIMTILSIKHDKWG